MAFFYNRRMNLDTVSPLQVVPILPFLGLGLLQLAWYVAVPVMLYKIWRKVRHLPG